MYTFTDNNFIMYIPYQQRFTCVRNKPTWPKSVPRQTSYKPVNTRSFNADYYNFTQIFFEGER